MSILLLVVFTTLGVSAICSLMEATLYSTRIATLEAAKSSRHHFANASSMLAMKKEVSRPTSAILILNTIANTAGATVAGMLAAQEFGGNAVPIFSVILTIAILLLSEILPKTLGAVHWRYIWPYIVAPLALIQKLLTPIIWLTQWFSGIIVRGKAPPVTTEAEILALIRLGAGVGELTSTELELLTNVFQFDEVITRQVMIPRREVVGFDTNGKLDQWLEIINAAGHTRYPLYDGSLDNICGLIHVKDLVKLRSHEDWRPKEHSRELISIPDTTPIRHLLRRMQAAHRHMAAVYDEHGTFVGIITLENVIEQIIGAIQDEFDDEQPDINKQSDGTYHIKGATPVFAVSRQLRLKIPCPSEIDTMSGLVTHGLDRTPEVGDRIDIGRAQALVLEMDAHRISILSLTVNSEDPENSDASE